MCPNSGIILCLDKNSAMMIYDKNQAADDTCNNQHDSRMLSNWRSYSNVLDQSVDA